MTNVIPTMKPLDKKDAPKEDEKVQISEPVNVSEAPIISEEPIDFSKVETEPICQSQYAEFISRKIMGRKDHWVSRPS